MKSLTSILPDFVVSELAYIEQRAASDGGLCMMDLGQGLLDVLWGVLEVADVHVPGRSDGGHPSPRRLVGAPHIEEEWGGGTRYRLGVRDHKLTVNVPVDVRGCPDDLEVVAVALVESGDLGVLTFGKALPVGAVGGILLASYSLRGDLVH